MTNTGANMTVLLGTRFEELERHGTRWRAVLARWAEDQRVSTLTVVDFPRFGPTRPVVAELPSWLPGARFLQVTVPGRTRGGVEERLGSAWAARALTRVHRPTRHHVVVAATPLWASVAVQLPAHRHGFDAVDDWRDLASMQHARRRIDAGYRATRSCDTVTSVSVEMSRRLADDYSVRSTTVPNGVDLAAYSRPAPAPDGLPDVPFAVYAGQVEDRVDLKVLGATARRVPVVVAGSATPAAAATLRSLPLMWLGPVEVGLVPGLLQRATVGLLPHRVDRLTASMDPMKLLEYLAAGLPVVATDLPGVALSPRVHVAEDFPRQVERLLAEPRRRGPDASVNDRDWDGVADRLLTLHADLP